MADGKAAAESGPAQDDLSPHPVKEVIAKVLKNDAKKAFDIAAYNQFNATPLTVAPTAATATDVVTLTTNGTVNQSSLHNTSDRRWRSAGGTEGRACGGERIPSRSCARQCGGRRAPVSRGAPVPRSSPGCRRCLPCRRSRAKRSASRRVAQPGRISRPPERLKSLTQGRAVSLGSLI